MSANSANLAYCRASLQYVLTDVRLHDPAADVKAAWVHRSGRTWEFIFGEFYWYSSADNAAEARAAGWSAWLRKQGAEGYKVDETI